MWPMKRKVRQELRSVMRNRQSTRLNVDRLEERSLLTFFSLANSIFPKATAFVAGQPEASNGSEITRSLLEPLNGFAETNLVNPNRTTASAFAKMNTTVSGRDGATVQSGTINITSDDLNVKMVNGTAARSRAQTNFTYRFRSTSNFKFTESGSFLWTWGVPRTTPGTLGSFAIYDSTGKRVAGSDLTVFAGTQSHISATSGTLRPGEYTIKLICSNDTNVTNTSTLRGSVNWSITTV